MINPFIALIGTKVGMSSVWINNKLTPITLVKINENALLDVKTYKTKTSLLISSGIPTKEKNLNKPQHKIFKDTNSTLSKQIAEFELPFNFNKLPERGFKFQLNDSLKDLFLDISGITIGKGFQGAVKKYGFAGGNATHGHSLSERSLGSTSGSRSKGGTRVPKNKKMAGHMGSNKITVKNCKIVALDLDLSLICIKGSLPGRNGSYLKMTNANNFIKNIDQGSINGHPVI